MEVRINAIHFDISEQLKSFVAKKADKLARLYPAIDYIDFNLRLIKPEAAMNKEAIAKVIVPHEAEMVATKTADTFEEAVDLALEAVERQLDKSKQKK